MIARNRLLRCKKLVRHMNLAVKIMEIIIITSNIFLFKGIVDHPAVFHPLLPATDCRQRNWGNGRERTGFSPQIRNG